jgi:hypothetical protein
VQLRARFSIGAAGTALLVLLNSTAAWSAERVLTFRKGSAHFEIDLAGNRTSFASLLAVLQNYGAQRSLQVLLVGELPPECSTAPDCEALTLLMHRAEAVASDVLTQTGGHLAHPLRWRAIAPAASHVEGLRLRVLSVGAQDFSQHCPYQVEISDPRLPPVLESTDGSQGWISLSGPAVVPMTIEASVRLKSSQPTQLTVRQSWRNGNVVLSTGASQAQWSARQLRWEQDAGEVIVDASPLPGSARPLVKPLAGAGEPSGPKGVGDELLQADVGPQLVPWTTDPPPAPPEGAGCHIRFMLLE